MFGSLYFILIKYQLAVKLAMLELMCFLCVNTSVPFHRTFHRTFPSINQSVKPVSAIDLVKLI